MDRQQLRLAIGLLILIATMPLWAGTEREARTEAWMKSMTPGAPHAALADQAGKWLYVATFWGEPGSPPTTSQGTATKTMILGGRYLREELSGEFQKQPFLGVGVTGYDNVTHEYVGTWYDNMSTSIQAYTGHEDAKGQVTFRSTMHDPLSGKAIPIRSVARDVDHDHSTFEEYMTGPDGAEGLVMRVAYTRAD